MDGGLYIRIQETAEFLMDKNNTPTQRAFGKHLMKVSDAIYETQKVIEGDKSEGEEVKAIKRVFQDTSSEKEILESDVNELIKRLKASCGT